MKVDVVVEVMVFILVFCAGIILNANLGSIVKLTDSLIEECEKELPRNQRCILQVVPEEME